MNLCGKVKYSSKQKAHHAIETIERAGKLMRAYECPHCHKWHLTSDLVRENFGKYK